LQQLASRNASTVAKVVICYEQAHAGIDLFLIWVQIGDTASEQAGLMKYPMMMTIAAPHIFLETWEPGSN
jgi:hypothetical protein